MEIERGIERVLYKGERNEHDVYCEVQAVVLN